MLSRCLSRDAPLPARKAAAATIVLTSPRRDLSSRSTRTSLAGPMLPSIDLLVRSRDFKPRCYNEGASNAPYPFHYNSVRAP